MNKEKNNVIIHDGHYHVEKMGGKTGPPIRVKTDDGRTTHIHKQSDDKDTVEALLIDRIPDDGEGSGSSLPDTGYHKHMQTDGQFTSPPIMPPTEGEQGVGIGGISEKIEAVLKEASVSIDTDNKLKLVSHLIGMKSDADKVKDEKEAKNFISKNKKTLKTIVSKDLKPIRKLIDKHFKQMEKIGNLRASTDKLHDEIHDLVYFGR